MGLNLDFYKHKRVLVTGHTGFAGTWLCKVLDMAGAHVTGYALEPETQPSFFYMCRLDKKVRSYIGDIRNYDALKEAFDDTRPEIVFHLAAQPLVLEGYEDPAYTFDVNTMGCVSVLECIRKSESVKSAVLVTTDKVYLNKEWPWGYRENEELKGSDPYSASKSCAELVINSYIKSYFEGEGIAISSARPSNLIGGGDFNKSRLIPDCVRAACDKTDIIIRNPFAIRSYQHVLEAVNALLLIAKAQYNDKTFAGSYNIGPDEGASRMSSSLVNIFCETWRRYTNQAVKWVNAPQEGPEESGFLKADTTKLKTVLGWYPRWDIEKAMEKTVEWYVEYRKDKDVILFMEKQIKEFFR